MDKIYINDLEIYGYHGVLKQEKDMGQKFLVSLELSLDLGEAGKKDDLSCTVNYAELCYKVEEEFKKTKYHLIETAAEKLAEFVLCSYNLVAGVKVLIKKPWAPIGKPINYAAVEVNRAWHKAFIGMGSNIGDKEQNLKDAIAIIGEDKVIKVLTTSEFYETKPVGYLDQDNFVNCAIEIKTLHTPKELIKILLDIEKELKRERIVRWGPRTIDLDVLLYDDIITSCEEIIIPHPRMHERLFVLKPLSDIAPYEMHPILKKRIKDLMEEISKVQELK